MSDLRSKAEAIDYEGSPGRLNAYIPGERVPAPDVADSGIPAELDVPVHVAWSRVMGEVEFVQKGRSPGLNYEFRGIDAVLNAVGPAIRKHGVIVLPVKITPEYTVVTSKSGAVMNYCRAVVRYVIMGPRGELMMTVNEQGMQVPLISESLGEAFDTGDKASTKAQSVALRTFYINALVIPTNEPERDPERGIQHELGAPPRPTPEQYAAEILADSTSIGRLQQIKAELDADPRTGQAEVEDLSGERVALARLVRRIGAARMAREKGE